MLQEQRLGRQGPSLGSRVTYPLTDLWQSNMGLRRADHVFCRNSGDKEFLVGRMGLPENRITLVRAGADEVYAELGAGRSYSRASRLLFAGSWTKIKGIQDLVPAFNSLAAKHPDLTLTVLGAGLPDSTVKLAFPEAFRNRVHCAHSNNDIENASQFAAADIFLLPSLLDAGPLTLAEAMMSGLPIVTTATGGMKDIIRHGQTGLLVPIRSPEAIVAALERLMDDVPLRLRLGHAARHEAMDKYTWSKVAEPVRRVYETRANPG